MQAIARPVRDSLLPALLGGWAAAVALAPTLNGKLILLAPGAAAAILFWTLFRPYRWLYLFFFCLLLLPPLPVGGGSLGVHVAPLAAGIGLLAGLLRPGRWRDLSGPLPFAFGAFLFTLVISLGFAALYSGPEIAMGSLIRILLFALAVYVFAYSFTSRQGETPDPFVFTRFLFYLAVGAALFACFDFYFQLPAPAGYGAQFVWLDQGVFRRAQGLFYESSTLGNFCAFFLTLVLVCLFRPRAESPISRLFLAIGGAILCAALIFSYSRGSIVNIVIAAVALAWLRRKSVRRSGSRRAVLIAAGLAVAAAFCVQTLFPAFSASYWARISASLQYVSSAPNSVLSGRLTNWIFLGDFLVRQPWTAIFGIGYKTLPYSSYAGATVIADNTYLGLLVETGIAGLAAFFALNAAILRTGLKAARSAGPRGRIFGEWIFCFWAGQMVQMFSGDLITYWRVLPVYFWVLAMAAREARSAACES